MRRAPRPEAVRAVEKVLLVDGLQHHRDRALQDLVLEGRDADRSRLRAARPSGCGPAARAAPGTCRTSRGRAATGGCPPGSPRTLARSARPRPWPRPCACVGTLRAASRCRCDVRAFVNAMSGASFASFAIRSSFVEMVFELGVSSIVPSSGSVSRRRPLLGRVPRVGSPASSLLLRRSDSSPPIPPRFVAFARRYRRNSAARRRRGLPGSWRTLAVHALLSDPGEAARPGLRARALLVGHAMLPSAF